MITKNNLNRIRRLTSLAVYLLLTCFTIDASNIVNDSMIPDSLRARYAKANVAQVKVDVLNDICFYLSTRNPEEAINISREALRISDSLKYLEGLYHANNNIGLAFYISSKYQQSLSCFSLALESAKDLDDKKKEASVLNNMALVYNMLGDYEKAIKINQDALKIRLKLNDTSEIAKSYNNLGITYHKKNEFSKALSFFRRSISLKEKQGDNESVASTYNNIGQSFFEMVSDTSMWALDSAYYYYMKAYNRWAFSNDKSGMGKVLTNIGNFYSFKNQENQALDAYRAALNTYKQVDDSVGIATALYNMGIMYYNKGDYSESKEKFELSLSISRTYNSIENIRDNLKILFSLAIDNKDYKTSSLLANEYLAINDSLNEIMRRQLIENYQGKYDYQLIESSNLQQKVSTSKIIIYILSLATLALAIAVSYLLFKKKK